MQQNTDNQNQTGQTNQMGWQNPVNEQDRITTQEPMSQVEMDQCIQDCIKCSDVCLQSATGNSDRQHGAYLRDCSELCLAAAHFMQRTGERCEQMGDTNCANACKNASWSLQQIAKMVAY